MPPVTDAAHMIGELRCAPLLHGYRGSPPADVGALADQITPNRRAARRPVAGG
ncbi:MAG TPA: hypothetical protein VFV66_32020 [Nonomuraea sp.]|nr:hypothetical protein [Nonomuraea sp.]